MWSAESRKRLSYSPIMCSFYAMAAFKASTFFCCLSLDVNTDVIVLSPSEPLSSECRSLRSSSRFTATAVRFRSISCRLSIISSKHSASRTSYFRPIRRPEKGLIKLVCSSSKSFLKSALLGFSNSKSYSGSCSFEGLFTTLPRYAFVWGL